ncbi:hypothetical protein BDV93DRAFT_512918 [Ceratobasidium sp. AG-I]|nr:hypothetical protein BDV93DRAFT_512918 [Ceratobasidium sp. AG-I]
MILTSLFTSIMFVFLALVQAFPVVPRDSNDWFSGFIRALDGAGLTTTSNVLMDFAITDPGQKFIELLQSSGRIFLAPGNGAFDSDHPSLEGDLFAYFTFNTLIDTPSSAKRQEAPAQSRDIRQTLMSKPTFSKRAGGTNQVQNHVYSSSYFSPSFNPDFPATTLSDQKLKYTNEGGTTYVSCGYTKATVLRSDIVTANGVMHVIDKLFSVVEHWPKTTYSGL